jgi:two-component system, NarL family, nitrate/nitrite response regulator NarL
MHYREETAHDIRLPSESASMAAFDHRKESRTPSLSRPPIQVHLVAPPLVCWGLQRLVQTAGAQFILVGCSDSLEEALPLMQRHPPDVVVLDLDDGYSVDDVARLYDSMRLKVLALSSLAETSFLNSVLGAGARGVLHKREAPAILLKGIEAIGGGEVFVSEASTDRLFMAAAQHATQHVARTPDSDHNKIASLTMRERQTIAAVTSDASVPVKVIASRLCISEHTLRNHLTSIYSKLGVCGRLGLYAYASQHALNKPQYTARGK